MNTLTFNRTQVFIAACLGILIFGMALITLGSVQPFLKEKFSLSEADSGTLFSIMPAGILAGSLLFGPACDKYGYKLVLTVSSLLFSIGIEGIAFADSISALKASIFIFGLGGGAINGATNAVVSDISEKNKGANLSILGIFFGVGSLGMPLLIGLLKNYFTFDSILGLIGACTFVISIFFLLIRFPEPKQKQGFPLKQAVSIIGDKVLLLVAFFLFFQSSFEAIINNWTPLYLVDTLKLEKAEAILYLTLYVAGLTVMRILLGSVFRNLDGIKIMYVSLLSILAGLIFLKFSNSADAAMYGLILLGVGLSAGFPIMLGFIGTRFTQLPGTAFSIVLVVALVGNILVNYLAGVIAEKSGINSIMSLAFAELAGMFILCLLIGRTKISAQN
ncbi:MAG: MFS transporter [Chitinophagaceae bacterium]|nr:MFS transporter [Chitinophagaceae bacterium]